MRIYIPCVQRWVSEQCGSKQNNTAVLVFVLKDLVIQWKETTNTEDFKLKYGQIETFVLRKIPTNRITYEQLPREGGFRNPP